MPYSSRKEIEKLTKVPQVRKSLVYGGTVCRSTSISHIRKQSYDDTQGFPPLTFGCPRSVQPENSFIREPPSWVSKKSIVFFWAEWQCTTAVYIFGTFPGIHPGVLLQPTSTRKKELSVPCTKGGGVHQLSEVSEVKTVVHHLGNTALQQHSTPIRMPHQHYCSLGYRRRGADIPGHAGGQGYEPPSSLRIPL